jgi:glycosyltransferase involved in cell wall biosynthesis
MPGLGIYQRLVTFIASPKIDADVVVSAHGDLLPYRSSSGLPAIHYRHYPLAVIPRYKELLGKYSVGSWRIYYEIYRILSSPLARRAAEEGIIVANSRFVAGLIKASLGVDPIVIYPPVEVDRFSKITIDAEREDTILMLGRYSPEKGYEEAIKLGSSLPRQIRLRILGTLTKTEVSYYRRLANLVKRLGLENRVELLYNVPRHRLEDLMTRSKVLLHMYRGEHFGIAVVEAMAAGLIPVVWSFGGPSEYVPKEYRFSSVKEARDKILKALEAPSSERYRMRRIAAGFSEEVFRSRFSILIESLLRS